MNRMLRVSDTTDGAFLDMPMILAPLSPDAHALQWRMLFLGEVIHQERWDLNFSFITRRLNETNGLELSFSELEEFARRTGQVVDGLFVAAQANPPRISDTDEAILSRAEMIVAAVDSSYWLIAAPEEALTRVEHRFRSVSEEAPFVWRGD